MDGVLKKIIFTIIMIFFSGGVFIFSIYTWFHPYKSEIHPIDFTISSNDSITFSSNGKDFKRVLTREDFLELPKSLEGVSTTFDGDISFYKSFSYFDGDKEYITSKKDNKSYLELSFSIQSDNDAMLYLSLLSPINIGNFDKSVRVGFIQGDSKIIWEPNSDIHSEEGVHKALVYYDKIVDLNNNKEVLEYRGIKKEISKKDKVLAYSKNSNYFSTVKPLNQSTIECFSLKKGIQKVKIYLWIESQDVDYNENDLFEQLQFSFLFTTKSS